jgi:hypothetical protein
VKVSMVFDDDGLGAALEAAAARSQAGVAQAVYATGGIVQGQVRANASSATHPDRASAARGHIPGTGPGPNVATGNYRRSIQLTPTREGENPVAYIHTNSAQARRLEYGFRGTDSLGRRYNQPAYPHFQPAADKAEDILATQIQRVLDKMIDDLKGKQ